MSKNKKITAIDRWMLVAVTIEPLVTLPQLVQIIRNHSAGSVSLLSWLGYDALSVIWLLYAKQQKDRMIILYTVLCIFIQSAIIIAGLAYGGKWI